MLNEYKKFLKSIKNTSYIHPENNIIIVNPITLYYEQHLKFLDYFFNDNKNRNLIIGLNPGKIGANKTGIAFTDPTNAIEYLQLDIPEDSTRERSSRNLYPLFLEAFNGEIDKFYQSYFITNLFLLGAVEYNHQHDLVNTKFDNLKKVSSFKALMIEHLKILIKTFKPNYIIAVGEDTYKIIKSYLKNNNPEIILIQAMHPAYGSTSSFWTHKSLFFCSAQPPFLSVPHPK